MNTSPYRNLLYIYHRDGMSHEGPSSNASRSPGKPGAFTRALYEADIDGRLGFEFSEDLRFPALTRAHFYIAHTHDWVNRFFDGARGADCQGLAWSREFARSVCYTNGSLLAACEAAVSNPDLVHLSPTSGFHHAQPTGGLGFCTFSGQVIAALSLWWSSGAKTAWVDLDGHFGNSIEDTRKFQPDLDKAIPPGFNINPVGRGERYLYDLAFKLSALKGALVAREIDLVCFAHGADSHEWDDFGAGQLTTAQWLEAGRMVYRTIREASDALGRPVPLVISLFGGYREDDYNSVLELHLADLDIGMHTLAGCESRFVPAVKEPSRG